MKVVIIIFSIFFSVSISAQNLRSEILALADSIAQLKSIPSKRFIYPNKSTFPLDSIATISELLELTNHKNANVRSCALIFLLNRKQNDAINFPDLFSKRLFDTTEVRFEVKDQNYTYQEKLSVGSLYAQLIGKYRGRTNMFLACKPYEARHPEKYHMDSLLLCQLSPLKKERENLAFSLQSYPTFYSPIKKQVVENNDLAALAYFTKYKKEEDIPIILAHLPKTKNRNGVTNTWNYLRFFRHPQIFAFLKNNLEAHWKENQYMVRIAEYQSTEALKLLKRIYELSKNEEKKHYLTTRLRRAIYQNYDETYADLFIQILKENAPFGYARIPDKLWEHRGEELFQLYEKWNASDNKWAKRDAAKMYPKAKEYTEKTNPQEVAQVVLSQIKIGETYRKSSKSFYYIQQSKDTIFIDPLFEILKKEPHANNRFYVTKVLMDYDDPDVNRRLKEFYKINPELIPDIRAAKEGGNLYKSIPAYAKQKHNY